MADEAIIQQAKILHLAIRQEFREHLREFWMPHLQRLGFFLQKDAAARRDGDAWGKPAAHLGRMIEGLPVFPLADILERMLVILELDDKLIIVGILIHPAPNSGSQLLAHHQVEKLDRHRSGKPCNFDGQKLHSGMKENSFWLMPTL